MAVRELHDEGPPRQDFGPQEGTHAVHFDLGLQGLGILLAIALGCGVVAQLVFYRSATRWIGVFTAIGAFIVGLYMSEVVMGTMTVDEIQPIIDGLAFDEALLGGIFLGGLPVALVTWFVGRRSRSRRTAAH
jgi:hypothetical protein